MPLQYVVLSLVLSFSSANEDSVYCALRYTRLCQEKGQHIACEYPDPGQGESCENYTKIEFTEEMRNLILHFINRHRQRLAAGHERARGGLAIPKPDIMMYVEWDRELAYLAQRLADQCRFVHDECRATVRYPYAGQTVGEVRWRRTRDSDQLTAQRAIRKVFDAWWGEKRRVHPQQLTSPFKVTAKGAVWGHFTQLAVWKLTAVGCGAVRHGPSHPRLLLVCDYSHTNMLGQRTLNAGPLATCPPHTARRPHSQYPLLCSKIKFQTSPYRTDYDQELANEKEIVRTEKTDEYMPDDEEEDTTTYKDPTSPYREFTETDIFIQKTKTTGSCRGHDSREEEYQRELTTEEEFYKDTDVYAYKRKEMKNVQEYKQEVGTSSTTHRYQDFDEERRYDIIPKYIDGIYHENNSDFEEERRKNIVPNNRNGDHYDKNVGFEEERSRNIAPNYRNGDHHNKNNDFDKEQTYNIVSKYRNGGHYEKNGDFEEGPTKDILSKYKHNRNYDENSNLEQDQRNYVITNNRDGDHLEKNKDFEVERRNKIVHQHKNGGYYDKKSDIEKERNDIIVHKHKDGEYYEKKADLEEERRNNIVQNYKNYEKQIPHLSGPDYSVIPLRNRHHEQANDVNIPWRPKLHRRTSTTEAPEYETSIILVPVRKKGHRLSTATAATLPPNVMRNILRTYHNRDGEPRLTTRVREKDLLHTVRRPLSPSLKLDKDDIDQLFRDTGFKPNWTPKT